MFFINFTFISCRAFHPPPLHLLLHYEPLYRFLPHAIININFGETSDDIGQGGRDYIATHPRNQPNWHFFTFHAFFIYRSRANRLQMEKFWLKKHPKCLPLLIGHHRYRVVHRCRTAAICRSWLRWDRDGEKQKCIGCWQSLNRKLMIGSRQFQKL